MLWTLDRHTNLFDIITGVQPENIEIPLFFIICQYYILRESIDILKVNDFILKNPEVRR